MDGEVFATLFDAWWRAFLFSLCVEGVLAALVARLLRLKVGRVVLASTLGTCLTHPLLWFVWSRAIADYELYITSGEILVTLVEALVILALARPITLRQALAISLIANGGSYGLGLIFMS